jgi:orotidine-5'-phosphate decarboxylase
VSDIDIAIAFDVPTLDAALELDAALGEGPELAKVGLQLFTAEGPAAVRALRERGRRVFLDLKLHDIPNTVRGAAQEAAKLGAELVTVHATGGLEMVAAAVEGAKRGGGTRIVAVTILTSLNAYNTPPGFRSPLHVGPVAAELLGLAKRAGAAGIVCSAEELPWIRMMHEGEFLAVTPGIRMAGGAAHDQKRVATVGEAVRNGAGLLVIGRAITGAESPRAALEAARRERDEAQAAVAAG